MDISETAAASGLKIGRYKQLIQKMKLLVQVYLIITLSLGSID